MQLDASPFSKHRQRHQIGRYDWRRKAGMTKAMQNLVIDPDSHEPVQEQSHRAPEHQRGPNNFSRRSTPHVLLERSAPRPPRLDLWFGHAEKAQNKPRVAPKTVTPVPNTRGAKRPAAQASKVARGFFDEDVLSMPSRASGQILDPSASNKKFWRLDID